MAFPLPTPPYELYEIIPATLVKGVPATNVVLTGANFLYHTPNPEQLIFKAQGEQIILKKSLGQFTVDHKNQITIPSLTLNTTGTYSITIGGLYPAFTDPIQIPGQPTVAPQPYEAFIARVFPGMLVVVDPQDGFISSPDTAVQYEVIDGFQIVLGGVTSSAVTVVKFEGPGGNLVLDQFNRPNDQTILLDPLSFTLVGSYDLSLFRDVAQTDQVGSTSEGALEITALDIGVMVVDRLTTSLLQPGESDDTIRILGFNFTFDQIDRIRLRSGTQEMVFTPQAPGYAWNDPIPANEFRLLSDTQIALGPISFASPGLFGVVLEKEYPAASGTYVWLGSRDYILTVKDTRKPAVVFDPPAQDFGIEPFILTIEAQHTDPVTGLPTGVVDPDSVVYYTTDGTRPLRTPAYLYPPKDPNTGLPIDLTISYPVIIYAIAVDSAGNVSDPKIGFFNIGGLKLKEDTGAEGLQLNFIRFAVTNRLIKSLRVKYAALLGEDEVPGVKQQTGGYVAGKSYLLRDIRRAIYDIFQEAGVSLTEAIAPPVVQYMNPTHIRVRPGREVFSGSVFPGNVGDINHAVTRYGEETYDVSGLADDTYGVFLAKSLKGHSYMDIIVVESGSPPTDRPYVRLAGTFDVISGEVDKTSIYNVPVDPVTRPNPNQWTDPDLDGMSWVPVKDIHWREAEIALLNAELPEDVDIPFGDDGTRPEDPEVGTPLADDPSFPQQYLPVSTSGTPLYEDTTPALADRIGDTPRGPKSANFSATINVQGSGKAVKFVEQQLNPPTSNLSFNGLVAGGSIIRFDIANQQVRAISPNVGCDAYFHLYWTGQGVQANLESAKLGVIGAKGIIFSGPGRYEDHTTFFYAYYTYGTPIPTVVELDGGLHDAHGYVSHNPPHGGWHSTPPLIDLPTIVDMNTYNWVQDGPYANPDESKVLARSGDSLIPLMTGSLPSPTVQIEGAVIPVDLTSPKIIINVTGGTVVNRQAGYFDVQVTPPTGSGKDTTENYTVIQGIYAHRQVVTDFTLESLSVSISGKVEAEIELPQTDVTIPVTLTHNPADGIYSLVKIPLTAFGKDGKWRLDIPPDVATAFVTRMVVFQRGTNPVESTTWTLTEEDSKTYQNQDNKCFWLFGPGTVINTPPVGTKGDGLVVTFGTRGSITTDLTAITFLVYVNEVHVGTYIANDTGGTVVYSGESPLEILGPDSATVEVIATADGSVGTAVNLKSAYTLDGTTPVINPLDPASGYSIGESIKYSVVPPRRIVEVGQPPPPVREAIKMVVEATNAFKPSDKITASFEIQFPSIQDNVTGWTPQLRVQNQLVQIPVDPNLTETNIVGSQTVTTYYASTTVLAPDPVYIEVLAKLLGSVAAQGEGRLHVRTAWDTPPSLPALGDPTDGNLQVQDSVSLVGPEKGILLRENNLQRDFYARVRAIDDEDSENVRELYLDVSFEITNTVTSYDVLIRKNATVYLLEDLATEVGPEDTVYLIDAADQDILEVVLQPTGTPGSQVTARVNAVRDATPWPVFQDPYDIVTYDENGVQVFQNTSYVVGIFSIDSQIPVVKSTSGLAFRNLTPGVGLKVQTDLTSTLNVNNTLRREFRIRAVAESVVTGLEFYYNNSRNPDDILPIQAGTDVNGTITGDGSFGNPFLIPVDQPEQFQAFARPLFAEESGLAFVQTGYAYDPTTVQELYPVTPESWHRAHGPGSNVLIHPHPVSPGKLPNKPLNGGQIIVASGGVAPNSAIIELKAVAQGVGSEANTVTETIYIQIFDPTP